METKDAENPQADTGGSLTVRKQGGWITFPSLIGTVLGLSLATSGAISNIMVYLIKEFNVKSIDAAQINNIINGCTSLAPLAGAIISDAFFGCFPVVAFSTFVTFLSLVLFTMTATIRSLRPTPCSTPASVTCEQPSAAELAVLYAAVGLLSIGTGGTRFNLMTMGADQFDKIKDQDVFFNWYFIVMYTATIIGATVIVYVQDSVSWGLGFGLSTVASAASVVVLTMGAKCYRRPKAKGSPFTGLARVIVAAIKKRKVDAREEGVNYYYGTVEGVKSSPQAPSASFSFLNRAAIITDGDTNPDGSLAKPWRLSTLQQVQDLKTLLRISPLWSSFLFLSVSIAVQATLTVLQALTMDRSLTRHFTIPAASIIVSSLATIALVLPLLDRLWSPAPLPRLGLGHLVNAAAMAASALVEKRRSSNMSVLWLVLPLAAAGVGESLHFPAQVALYYREFPMSMRSTATGMVALIVAVGFYGGTAVVGVVRRVTDWLPEDVSEGRMENVFWMLAVVGVINFGYFVCCAVMFKHKSREIDEKEANI